MLKDTNITSWGATQVAKAKSALHELMKLDIIDQQHIDLVKPDYMQRLAILIDTMGMSHPEAGFQQYVAEAKAKFGVE